MSCTNGEAIDHVELILAIGGHALFGLGFGMMVSMKLPTQAWRLGMARADWTSVGKVETSVNTTSSIISPWSSIQPTAWNTQTSSLYLMPNFIMISMVEGHLLTSFPNLEEASPLIPHSWKAAASFGPKEDSARQVPITDFLSPHPETMAPARTEEMIRVSLYILYVNYPR